jgi:hypothetical protein
MHFALWMRARLGGWLLATAVVMALRAAAAPIAGNAPVAVIVVTTLCALTALSILAQRADRTLWYLEERRA